MNVYGTGLPRSGTTMLARCLSVVQETHHECYARARMNEDFSRAGKLMLDYRDDRTTDVSVFEGHDSEVAWYFTLAMPALDGKWVHLWRPFETWLDAALRFDLLDPLTPRRIGELTDRWDGEDRAATLTNMWVEFQEAALDNSDNYIVTADRIVWPDLFDWLGWKYTEADIIAAQELQRTRPNKDATTNVREFRGAPKHVVEIQKALEERTKFTRLQAGYML